MQTQKVISISPLSMVVIPSLNASYQIQELSPGKSTYSLISRREDLPTVTSYIHPHFVAAELTGAVCSLQHFPVQKGCTWGHLYL